MERSDRWTQRRRIAGAGTRSVRETRSRAGEEGRAWLRSESVWRHCASRCSPHPRVEHRGCVHMKALCGRPARNFFPRAQPHGGGFWWAGGSASESQVPSQGRACLPDGLHAAADRTSFELAEACVALDHQPCERASE
jgi:hypothetical protein